MKQIFKACMVAAAILFSCQVSFAQSTNSKNSSNSKTKVMKTYVIEREVPAVGNFTPQQLQELSQASCKVLADMGPSIKWIQSYVTGNKIYCVYQAENEELVRQHAKQGGFPCNSVSEVAAVISPKTAEGVAATVPAH